MKYMTKNTKKNLVKALFILALSALGTGLFAWEGAGDLTMTGSGNTVVDHPPVLAHDGRPQTYAAFRPGTDGWLKVSLNQDSLIRGVRINGFVPASVWGAVGYEQEGMLKMFPSGYFRDQTGEFVIDVAKSEIISDEVFLIFHGEELDQVMIHEVEVRSQPRDEVYYSKPLRVREAGENTSLHTSEFQINDGYPGTYWAVRAPEEWGRIHWHVQQDLRDRYPYNRSRANWKEGFIELETVTPAPAELLKLYVTDSGHGEMSVKVKAAGTWRTVDTVNLDLKRGWLSYALDATWGEIQGIRLDVKGQKKEFGGIGEVELWGTGDFQGLTHEDLLPANYGDGKEEAGFFEIPPGSEGEIYTLTAVFREREAEESGLSLNGTEIVPTRIVEQDQIFLFEYDLKANQLWEGENFFGVTASASNQFLSVHLTKQVRDGKLRRLSGIPGDGRILNGTFGQEEGEIVLDGEYELLRVKVYYQGSSPGRVYQKIQGPEMQGAGAQYGMMFLAPGEMGAEGPQEGRGWGGWPRRRRPRPPRPNPPTPEPPSYDPVYLDVLEQGEGYVLYQGRGAADTLGFTGGSGITEIELIGSRSEKSVPMVRMINPVPYRSYQENEIHYKTAFGVTDTPDAEIRINGKKAKVSGNIFWAELRHLGLRQYGLQDITAEITDSEGRTSSYTIPVIIQSDRYWIELEQQEMLTYTRDESFQVSGRANQWTNNLYINDSHVPISRNRFSREVPLKEGLNLIEIRFTDRWTNRVVAYYIRKVYKVSGEILVDIKNPVDGIFVNEPETHVSGFARGAGLRSVTVNGIGTRIQGSSFCTLEAIPLLNEENPITVTAVDKTGYETTKTITVYRDITPPEISGVEPVNGTWFSYKDVTFSGIATDDNTCSVFVNGHMAMRSGDNFLVVVNLAERENLIDVMAVDLAGNTAHYPPFTIKIDTTPPESFTIGVDPEGWTNNRRPELSFETVDTGIGISHYEVSINGQNYVYQSSPVVLPFLDDGVNTVYVRVYDHLGNVRTEEAQLLIDTTPPDEPEDFRIVPGPDNVTLRWHETDEETLSYRILSPRGEEYVIHRESGQYFEEEDFLAFEWMEEGLTPGEEVRYTVLAVDRAGNASEASVATAQVGIAKKDYSPEEGAIVEYETISLFVGMDSLPEDIEEVLISEVLSEDMEERSINPIISPIYSFVVRNDDGDIQNHVEFEKDYIASIDYAEEDIPEGFSEYQLGVFYYDPMWGRWFKVEDSGIDIENNRIFFSTNHFTEFSVQPTVIEELPPQELSDVEYSPFDSKIGHSPVSISPQGGGATMSMTEFVLPGKNGLDLELRRLYDSATARADASGLSINVGLDLYDLMQGGAAILEMLVVQAGLSVGQQVVDTVKNYFLNNGDYAYSMGQGWRLNFPYIKGAYGAVIVRTPDGSFHNVNAMTLINSSSNGAYRDLVFESHENSDFTLHVKQFRGNVNYVGLLTGNVDVPDWSLLSAELHMKDGTRYSFDALGRLKFIKNPLGDRITFHYKNMTLDHIEDTYGRKIRFEYEIFSEIIGFPQITKIWVDGDDREIIYTYNSQLTELLGKDLPSLVSLSLPLLEKAEDFGQREWHYGYTDEFLFAANAGVEVNPVAILLHLLPAGVGHMINGVLGIDEFEIYGGVQSEFVFPINQVEGRGIGTTKLSTDVETLDYFEIEGGDYFLGLFPTSIQLEVAMQQKFLYDKMERFNGAAKVFTETYDYDYSYGDHKQFYNRRTVVNNGALTTTYLYEKETKNRNRWIDWSDQWSEGLVTENPILKEVIPLNTKIVYVDNTSGFIESRTMQYDGLLRVVSERVEKGLSNYTQTSYAYDSWGNRILVDTTEVTGETTYRQIARHQYQRNKIPGYDNPFGSLAVQNPYIHNLLRGSVVTTSISGSHLTDAQPPARIAWYHYNALGQRTAVQKMIDPGVWFNQSMAYYPVSDGFESGQLQSVTTALDQGRTHTTSYAYERKGAVYTRTRTETDVLQADDSLRDQTSSTVFEWLTGNVAAEIDGRGFETSYSYDNLDRITEVVKPDDNDQTGGNREDNPTTAIVYNDVQLTTTVTDSLGAGAFYDYDEMGQLVYIRKDNRFPSKEEIQTSLAYDGYGNIVSVTDPNNHVTQYGYDGKNRLIAETYINPQGGVNTGKTYAYLDLNNGRSTTYENGTGLIEYFDMRGNVVYKGDLDRNGAVLRSWMFVYDFDNNVLASMDPQNVKTHYAYNSLGLPKEEKRDAIVGFDGESDFTASYTLRYGYDVMGNRSSESETLTADKTRLIEYGYNGLKEIIRETVHYTDHNGTAHASPTKHFYNETGQEIKTIDGNGITTEQTYSARGQITSETDGLGNKTTYEYDKEDRLVSMTGPRGNSGLYPGLDFTIDYEYDDLDRLINGLLPKRGDEADKRTIVFDYDPRGNLLSRTEPDGGVTSYSYNHRNWMTSETRSGTSESGVSRSYENTYTYDAVGNRTREEYPIGAKDFAYDDLNRLVQETAQDGAVTRYRYDVADNLLSEKDGNGSYTYYDYDLYNRMIRMVDAKFQESEYKYDLLGNRTALIDARGNQWSSELDELGRVIKETNSRDLVATYEYDAGGRLKTLTDPNGTVISYSYYNNKLLKQATYTSGEKTQTESYTYDEGGVVKTASIDGVVKRYNTQGGSYTPDPYGLIAREELSFEGHSYATGYSYDDMNRLGGVEYSGGLSVSQSWNNLGQMEEVTGYASGFTYDNNGLMSGYTQGNGVKVSYTYDTKNRLDSLGYSSTGVDLLSYAYDYDKADNMILRNDDEYAYDRLNQLIVASISSEALAVEFKVEDINLRNADWDILGQKQAETVSGELSVDYDASSLVVDYGYPYRISRVELDGSALSSLVDVDKLKVYTAMFNNDEAYTEQEDVQVSVDLENGHISVKFDDAVFARFMKLHCHFNEMDRNRNVVAKSPLLTVEGIDDVQAMAIRSGRNEFYEYDPKGNRTKRLVMDIGIDQDLFGYEEDSDLLRSYGDMGYRYDNNGNLVEKGTQWMIGVESVDIISPEEDSFAPDEDYEYYRYEYDLKNRLRAAYRFDPETNEIEKAAEYLYDIDGYRIRKTDSEGTRTHYVFDTTGKVLEEVDVASGEVVTSVFLKNRHLARVEGGETLFYGTDHLSSTVLMTDESGNTVWSGDVTPFGDVAQYQSDLEIGLKYTGKDLDEDVGLYYFNARWYDADMGRFITEDPIRDGQNWYVYCSNNPMNRVDPTGLFELETREIQKGDTLSEIAETLSEDTGLELSVEHLARTNGIENPDLIFPGDRIDTIVPEIARGTAMPINDRRNLVGISKILTKPLDIAMDPTGPFVDLAVNRLQEEISGPIPQNVSIGPLNLKTTQAIGIAEAGLGAYGMGRSLVKASQLASGKPSVTQGIRLFDNFIGSAGVFAFGLNQYYSDEIKNPADAFKPLIMSATE